MSPDDITGVEERVRAATRARTDLVTNTRPIEFGDLAALAREHSTGRHWFTRSDRSGWLVPLTAAAAVVAVAGILVAVRTDSGSAAPAATSSSTAEPSSVALPTSVPPYYVTLAQIKGSGNGYAVLGDTSTGKTLVTVKPPVAGSSWQAVATSANDSTFVIYGGVSSMMMTNVPTTKTTAEVFDVLRVPSGNPQQTKVTRLTLAGPSYNNAVSGGGIPGNQGTTITGVAVSPDGQTIAVLSQQVTQTKRVQVQVPVFPTSTATASPKATATASGKASPIVVTPAASPSTTPRTVTEATAEETTLRTYSLATGQVLHTWTEPDPSNFQDADNGSLSWLADGHTLTWFISTTGPSAAVHWDLQTLDIASPGTSLAADSHTVFHTLADTSCQDPVATEDGKSVICAKVASGAATCGKGEPSISAYSVATGKLESVLYSYNGTCQVGWTNVEWAASASLVVGERLINVTTKVISKPEYMSKSLYDGLIVITPTRLTPLPIAQTGALNGSQGFAAF